MSPDAANNRKGLCNPHAQDKIEIRMAVLCFAAPLCSLTEKAYPVASGGLDIQLSWPGLSRGLQLTDSVDFALGIGLRSKEWGRCILLTLKSLCQRCHMIHDRPHHLARRRMTYRRRRALGDLFLGPYKPI